MIRKDFLKSICSWALIWLSRPVFVKPRKEIWLLSFFVRGFQYYNGPKMIDKMKPGDFLELVRESQNKFDSNAIAIHCKNQKIGFVPAEKNEVLSRLMDADAVKLFCEIIEADPGADTWESLYVGVYILEHKFSAAA